MVEGVKEHVLHFLIVRLKNSSNKRDFRVKSVFDGGVAVSLPFMA